MNRIDGTAARQLDLIDDHEAPLVTRRPAELAQVRMRVLRRDLRRDLYSELARRRRRAQITARRELDRS